MQSPEDNAKRLVQELSLLLGVREQDLADPTMPSNIVASVRRRLEESQAKVKSWQQEEARCRHERGDARKQAQEAREQERRDLAAFAKAEAEKFTAAANKYEAEGNGMAAIRCNAQASAFRTMQAYVMRGDHEGAVAENDDVAVYIKQREMNDPKFAAAFREEQERLNALATKANPTESYRSIALANGAKECNVYHHDDKVVVVVEMGLNRSFDDVQVAIQKVTPLISKRNIVVREVRSMDSASDILQPLGFKPTQRVDHLADLERRIAELETRVRNNTRRLDLAAAACIIEPGHTSDEHAWLAYRAINRLAAGLKEQA